MSIRGLGHVALALLSTSSPAWSELAASIEGAVLHVEGVSTGGEVALLSVWREQVLDGPHFHQTTIEETLIDDDQDGKVEFEAERDIPLPSIWGVVDMKTGESIVVVPEGFPLRELALGKEANLNRAGRLRISLIEIEVLVIRPETGRWRGRARDGVTRDADHDPDRGVTFALEDLEAEGETGGELNLRPGDVVIAIDPLRMAVLNVRL